MIELVRNGDGDRRPDLGGHVHDQGGGRAVGTVPDEPRGAARDGHRETRTARLEDALARLDSAFVGNDPRLLRAPPARAAGRGRRRPGLRRDGRAGERRGPAGGLGALSPSGSSPTRARSCRASPRSTSDSRSCARPTRRSPTTRTSRRRSGPSSRRRTSRRRARRRPGVPGTRAGRTCRPRCRPEAGASTRNACGAPRASGAAGHLRRAGLRRSPRCARPRSRNRRRPGACAFEYETLVPRRPRAGTDALAALSPPDPDALPCAPASDGVRRVAPPQRPAELPGPAPDRPRPAPRPSPTSGKRLPGTLPAHPRRRVPGHRPDPGRDPLLPDGRGHRRRRTGESSRRSPAASSSSAIPSSRSIASAAPTSRPTAPSATASRRAAAAEADGQLPFDGASLRLGQRRLRAAFFPETATARQAAWVPLSAQREEASAGRLPPSDADAGPVPGRRRRSGRPPDRERHWRRRARRASDARTTSSCCFARASSCPTTRARSRHAGSPTSFREAEPSKTPRS